MTIAKSPRNRSWNLLRWMARIWSLGPIFFVGAELISPHVTPDVIVPPSDWFLVSLLSLSALVLALAWWREGLGGALSLIFLALLLVLYTLIRGEFFPWQGLVWMINIVGPALLFLLYDRRGRISSPVT